MRKVLLLSACLIGLSGCATVATPDFAEKSKALAANIAATSQSITEKISSAKAYTLQVCNYVPTSASLIALFNSSFGAAVGTVGDAIVNAVRSAPFADGPANFRVNGVMVKGRFVR